MKNIEEYKPSNYFDDLMFCIIDVNNIIVDISHKLCDFIGYKKDEVLQTSHIIPSQKNSDNIIFFKRNKEVVSFNVSSKDIYIDDVKYFIKYYNNTTENYNSNYYYYDKKFTIKQKKIFSEYSKNNNQTGFGILFNIIGFSYINETYGREIGDKTLCTVATLLNKLENIEIFKLDGDAFLLLVQNFNNENANTNFESIKKEVDKIFYKKLIINDYKIKINYKFVGGLYKYKNMLLNLNIYLKRIKEKRINSFFVEDNNILPHEKNYIDTLNALDYAIKNDSVFLEYQPIFDNKTKSINKYESLVRIKDKNKIIYPDSFIDVAQKTNYYTLLTKTIVTMAFEKFYNEAEIEFSVNLDILDIENSQTIAFILSVLEDFPYPENVIFELTEVNQVEDYTILIDFIKKVKYFNAKIAIDDFGSGYSNFELLTKIDFDFIKIDGSLIKNIDTPKVLSVIRMIVVFAKANNIKTIAEYVSSEEIYQKVLDLGIDYSQGWYLGKSNACLIDEKGMIAV